MSIYVLIFQLSSTTMVPYSTKAFLIEKRGTQQHKTESHVRKLDLQIF